MKCFMIPFAGSMGCEFISLKKEFKDRFNIVLVEYKGRGRRIREEFYKSWDEVLDDVYNQIVPNIGDEDYILFGHSMGATVVYELYFRLKANNIKMPRHIFLSGINIPGTGEKVGHLDEEKFRQKFIKLGGIQKEVLESEELCKMVFEIIRNDILRLEEYEYKKNPEAVECDITIMNGLQDEIVSTETEWKDYLRNQNCTFLFFEGGHFYLLDRTEEVMQKVYDMTVK